MNFLIVTLLGIVCLLYGIGMPILRSYGSTSDQPYNNTEFIVVTIIGLFCIVIGIIGMINF